MIATFNAVSIVIMPFHFLTYYLVLFQHMDFFLNTFIHLDKKNEYGFIPFQSSVLALSFGIVIIIFGNVNLVVAVLPALNIKNEIFGQSAHDCCHGMDRII